MARLPSLREFAPKRGYAPNDDLGFAGSVVRLTGANLNVGQSTVQFGGAEAQVLSRSRSRIDVRVPSVAPGPCSIRVTTGAGSTIAAETFLVLDFPVIDELDPFGFSRDPSGENLVIIATGRNFVFDDARKTIAFCRLTPRFDPEVQHASELVVLAVGPVSPTSIELTVPPIDEFDRFVRGTGVIVLEFLHGLEVESESWTIEGL
jgi:hypothetical protein